MAVRENRHFECTHTPLRCVKSHVQAGSRAGSAIHRLEATQIEKTHLIGKAIAKPIPAEQDVSSLPLDQMRSRHLIPQDPPVPSITTSADAPTRTNHLTSAKLTLNQRRTHQPLPQIDRNKPTDLDCANEAESSPAADPNFGASISRMATLRSLRLPHRKLNDP